MKHLKLILLLVLVCLTYSRIYTIPFLYDEKTAIEKNEIITHPETALNKMLTWKGIFQKPLAILSLATNYELTGEQTWSYHLFNLLVHLGCIILLYIFAQGIFRWPLIPTALFALHPLATGGVSKIYSRDYTLGTFFMLAALIVYWNFEADKKSKRRLGLTLMAAMCFLATLSKQTFIVIPGILFLDGAL